MPEVDAILAYLRATDWIFVFILGPSLVAMAAILLSNGFEFAEMFNRLHHSIECSLNVICVGQNNVAPEGIRAAGYAQGIAQSASGEGQRQSG